MLLIITGLLSLSQSSQGASGYSKHTAPRNRAGGSTDAPANGRKPSNSH